MLGWALGREPSWSLQLVLPVALSPPTGNVVVMMFSKWPGISDGITASSFLQI